MLGLIRPLYASRPKAFYIQSMQNKRRYGVYERQNKIGRQLQSTDSCILGFASLKEYPPQHKPAAAKDRTDQDAQNITGI